MHFTGSVIISFKKSVLEPQGKAIQLSLKEQGIEGVELIRVGKSIEVTVNASSKDEAKQKISDIAEKVLYNPVMEVCEIETIHEKN